MLLLLLHKNLGDLEKDCSVPIEDAAAQYVIEGVDKVRE